MRQNLVVILFALLIAGFLTFVYMHFKKEKVVWVKVLTATKNMKTGEKFLSNSLTWIKRPQNSIQPNMITNEQLAERVMGSVVKTNMQVGQPVLINNVQFIGGGIAARILDKGMFAVTMGLPKRASISKLITRGDRINIILTRKINKQIINRVILEKIFVMMIAPSYSKADETANKNKRDKSQPNTMVLAMNAEQVKKLILASHLGRLNVALVSAHADGKKSAHQDYMYGDKTSPTIEEASDLNEVQVIRGLEKRTRVLP